MPLYKHTMRLRKAPRERCKIAGFGQYRPQNKDILPDKRSRIVTEEIIHLRLYRNKTSGCQPTIKLSQLAFIYIHTKESSTKSNLEKLHWFVDDFEACAC